MRLGCAKVSSPTQVSQAPAKASHTHRTREPCRSQDMVLSSNIRPYLQEADHNRSERIKPGDGTQGPERSQCSQSLHSLSIVACMPCISSMHIFSQRDVTCCPLWTFQASSEQQACALHAETLHVCFLLATTLAKQARRTQVYAPIPFTAVNSAAAHAH